MILTKAQWPQALTSIGIQFFKNTRIPGPSLIPASPCSTNGVVTITGVCCCCSACIFQAPSHFPYIIHMPHTLGYTRFWSRAVIWESEDVGAEALGALHTLLVTLLPLCAMKQQSSHCGISKQQLLEAQKSDFALLFTGYKSPSAAFS